MTELRIAIRELPLRPRVPAQYELLAVFGGCYGTGGELDGIHYTDTVCQRNKDCCSGKCGPRYAGDGLFFCGGTPGLGG
jgi:hypothetical protein